MIQNEISRQHFDVRKRNNTLKEAFSGLSSFFYKTVKQEDKCAAAFHT